MKKVFIFGVLAIFAISTMSVQAQTQDNKPKKGSSSTVLVPKKEKPQAPQTQEPKKTTNAINEPTKVEYDTPLKANNDKTVSPKTSDDKPANVKPIDQTKTTGANDADRTNSSLKSNTNTKTTLKANNSKPKKPAKDPKKFAKTTKGEQAGGKVDKNKQNAGN